MNKMVELVFRGYKEKEEGIQKGFISAENIQWVTEHLMLKQLSDKELTEMWQTVREFFLKKMLDKSGQTWRNDIPIKEFNFYSDTSSAWLEVINEEARSRRRKNTI